MTDVQSIANKIVENVERVKEQAGSVWWVDVMSKVGIAALDQQSLFNPPQIPEVLPAIEAIAGNAGIQV